MSKIEWTGKTDGIVAGCEKESEGCANCYAMGQVHRFAGTGTYDREDVIKIGANPKRPGLTFLPRSPDGKSLGKGAQWTGEMRLMPHRLEGMLRRRKSTTYFPNSLGDIFHPKIVSDDRGRRFLAAFFGAMAATPQHTYQVLTKHPASAREWFSWIVGEGSLGNVWQTMFAATVEHMQALGFDSDHFGLRERMASPWPWPLPNVWIGTSVENQDAADKRIPDLLRVPAAVRFLSCEPLLGPVDLRGVVAMPCGCGGLCDSGHPCPMAGSKRRVDWVIAGGESGKKARPMHPDWARGIRNQCVEAGVPFFFKQWGAWTEDPGMSESDVAQTVWGSPPRVDVLGGAIAITQEPRRGVQMWRVGKKVAGRELDGRTWDQLPEPKEKS